jgi:hypothetical protein
VTPSVAEVNGTELSRSGCIASTGETPLATTGLLVHRSRRAPNRPGQRGVQLSFRPTDRRIDGTAGILTADREENLVDPFGEEVAPRDLDQGTVSN